MLVQCDQDRDPAEDDEEQDKSKKPTRQRGGRQVDRSGTVPSRYRSSVPKEYHHLIPFAK